MAALMMVTPPRQRKALKTFHHVGKASGTKPSTCKNPPVETQQDAILIHAPPSCPPFVSIHENQSNHAPFVCSALDLLVGGHAAAFTSPLGISPRPGGISDQTSTDEGLGDSPPTLSASALSAFLHSDLEGVEVPNFASDSGAHVRQTTAATTSIFDRSAKLCNHVCSKPMVDHGARARGAGQTAAQHRSACALNFDDLSAQALASERVH